LQSRNFTVLQPAIPEAAVNAKTLLQNFSFATAASQPEKLPVQTQPGFATGSLL
jgi:hypothetical protein